MNDPLPETVTGNASDLEQRIRARIAEAEGVARVSREALTAALSYPDGRVGASALESMARTARVQEMLALALRDVLEGES